MTLFCSRRLGSGVGQLLTWLGWWGRASLDLVFARQCANCAAPLSGPPEQLLCDACCATLAGVPSLRCPRCAARVAVALPQGAGCAACRPRRLKFDRVFPLGSYEGALRQAVLRLKRPGHEALALALGTLLAEHVGRALAALPLDAVVPVPMHWQRRLARGTNSPELLAEPVARWLRLPLARRLLRRRRNTPMQTDLSPPQRFQNIRGAFAVSKGYPLAAARLLLVDDVLTTGATASEAAATLLRAGAASVSVAVVARTDYAEPSAGRTDWGATDRSRSLSSARE